ncbi:hypothetical protein [Mycobacterium sp. 94-17]|uniref:hypothetical protein n=1 Tax=Mycobacterium sp. 94-17 TaxID=2986147 RepID=UPI002D1F4799|nr:hypothetical protein [Mycobacterium sp. 94-17]MEB4208601.1 hypothetical protein [Mycobacterium sp. 94-17]
MPDYSEIDKLISLASETKSTETNRRLFAALRGVELFFPRTKVEHEGGQVNATPLLRLSDGTNAMMLYTSKDHPDLPDTFAGGAFEDALTAALSMPELDWVIVCNRGSQWVAINKRNIPVVLNDPQPRDDHMDSSAQTPENDGNILEELITRAVNTPPEELSPPIGSVLRGRQIFIELAEGQREDEQPVMKTFTVQNMHRVIRAYTTRRRQGIRYGGMQWQALKNMIRTTTQLDGVQIVNDADDWVIFDRESLITGGTGDS